MAPYLTPNIMRHAMPAMTGDTIAGMASSAVMIGRPWVTRLSSRAMAESQEQLARPATAR